MRALAILTIFFIASLIITKSVFASSQYFYVDLSSIANDKISRTNVQQDDTSFPFGNDIIFPPSTVPFNIPSDIIQFNCYASGAVLPNNIDPTSSELSLNINQPTDAYFLMTGIGTNIWVPNEEFGQIQLDFYDADNNKFTQSTTLIEGFNIREWINNDSSNYQITTDLNTSIAFTGYASKDAHIPTTVTLLHISINSENRTRKLKTIRFIDSIPNASYQVMGVTIQFLGLEQGNEATVFIPGLGGSWNQDALIMNKTVNQSDWVMTPIYTDEYKSLFKTLTNAGLEENKTLFGFYYDWRQPISKTSQEFYQYLTDKFPNDKVKIIGHSMGGLVARNCIENISGCKDKIEKLITAGTPHSGSVNAYYLWHDVVTGTDPMARSLESVLIKIKGGTVQSFMPSVKDLLPIFDYIDQKPYDSLTTINKNSFLKNLGKNNTTPILTTLSGNMPNSTINKLFTISKLWGDGIPYKISMGPGDDTVLENSANLAPSANFSYPTYHAGLVGTTDPQKKILEILGLPTDKKIESVDQKKGWRGVWFIFKPKTLSKTNLMATSVNSTINFSVICDDPVTQIDTNVFVVLNPTDGKCKINTPASPDGNYQVFIGDISSTKTTWQTFKGSGKKETSHWYRLKYHKDHNKCELFDQSDKKVDLEE